MEEVERERRKMRRRGTARSGSKVKERESMGRMRKVAEERRIVLMEEVHEIAGEKSKYGG